MTKYKLNNTLLSSSEVTLTSYMGSTDIKRDDRYQISELDTNQNDNNTESNRNLSNSGNLCNHSCDYLQTDKLAASLAKQNDKFGLNELRVDNLDKNVCLCEKYNGGCKLCPRPSLAPMALSIEGKECANCNGNSRPASYYKNSRNTDSGFPLKNGSGGGSGSGSGKDGSRVWQRRIARRAKTCCSPKSLVRRIPILGWLPAYTWRYALADLIAGVTVGLTVIPQGIAYAGVAGLPPQYGLYSSFMACFVYTIFGSVKDSAIGPTAIAAILTRENLHGLGPEFAVLLCFLSGCVELLMGILQLGFLIDFISGPVSVGFTSAAAIIIATTQIKDILGLSFPGGKFLQVWTGLYEHIGETRLWDTILGLSCIVVLLLLRKVKDIKVSKDKVSSPSPSRMRELVSQSLWFLSTTRNILVVLVCAGLAYYYDTREQRPFVLTGEVKAGLPEFSLPPFSATVGNHTYTFMEMASTLGSAIFVVPLLSILENIALAKVFSDGKVVDATQEMIALGVCNMVASAAHSMPVSGALSRGAVNHASGVSTTAGGIYTGVLVLLSLQYFTPYFFYIPKASLAAVIIAAVVFMMELHVFKPIWRTKKLDIIPAVVTFVSCLVTRLELGIVIGIATNLVFLLYASARPSVKVIPAVSVSGVPHVVVSVDRSLSFPGAEFVRREVGRAADTHTGPVVLDARHVQAADFTAARGIKSLIDDFHARGQSIIFYNVKPSIVEIFNGVRPREFRHCDTPTELDQMLLEAIRNNRNQQNS